MTPSLEAFEVTSMTTIATPTGSIPIGTKLLALLDTELEALEGFLYQDLFRGVARFMLPLLEWIPFKLRYPTLLDIGVGNQFAWPPVLDQGTLGSCTDNAVAAAMFVAEVKDGGIPQIPSRLFLYGNARGWTNEDTGSSIGACVKGAREHGAPPEPLWPYEVSRFAVKPPQDVWVTAAHTDILHSHYVLTLGEMLHCLNSRWPFVFAMSIFSNFAALGDANGWTLPAYTEDDEFLGRHCMLVRGFDLEKRLFLVQNSWGADWGLKDKPGCCYIPFDVICSPFFSDAWRTIRKVS